MNICIVSRDKRYIKVNELLCENGYNSVVITDKIIPDCDVLILSVRNEFTDDELSEIFSQVSSKVMVLCGNAQKIKRFFDGRVIDYSLNEDFLQSNAVLTAEATISYLHSVIEESVNGKSVFIAGYGRIGKALCRLLSSLGANVYVYARRSEIKTLVERDGFTNSDLKDCINCQIIINTVPSVIFDEELISMVSNDAYIIDLASPPYGFKNMQRVHLASGLPGKILPISAARVVFDTILCILSSTGKEYI